jgi:hypothetical protein
MARHRTKMQSAESLRESASHANPIFMGIFGLFLQITSFMVLHGKN